jgi:TonB family protein
MNADIITTLNNVAAVWWIWFAAITWQASLFIAVVAIADRVFGRVVWPQVRYAVWLLVFVKLVLPPTLASSWSVAALMTPFGASAPVTTVQYAAENIAPIDVGAISYVVTTPTMSLYAVLALIWVVGVIALGGWTMAAALAVSRLGRTASTPAAETIDIARAAAANLRLRSIPRIRVTDATSRPAVFGLIRPTVFLPPEIVNGDRDDLRHILLHEFAHIKRGDLPIHAVASVILILFWPNILAWYAMRLAGELRELCTDATVATLLREQTPRYRATLLSAARAYLEPTQNERMPRLATGFMGLLGLMEGSTMIMERLRRLNTDTWTNARLHMWSSIAVAAMLLIFVIPMSPAADESTSDVPELPDQFIGEVPMPPVRPEGAPPDWEREETMAFITAFKEYKRAWQEFIDANNIKTGRPTSDQIAKSYPPPGPPEGEPESWSTSQRQAYADAMREYAMTLQNRIVEAEEVYDRKLQDMIQEYESTPGREAHAVVIQRLMVPSRPPMQFGNAPLPASSLRTLPESGVQIYSFWMVDVKPRPLNRPMPEYPEMARSAGMEGEVFIELDVDTTGLVMAARVLRGQPIFHEAALAAGRRLRFTPGIKDGKLVSVIVAQRIVFDLPGRDGNQSEQMSSTAQRPPAPESGNQIYQFWMVDVKPEPLNRVMPDYPEVARSAGVEGEVFVELEVDTTGLVRAARVLRGPSAFHEAALAAAKQYRFTPAVKEGKLVPVIVAQRIVFDLSGGDGDQAEQTSSMRPHALASGGQPYQMDMVDRPPRMIGRPDAPEYPEPAVSAGMEGDVFVEMVVDSLGIVKEARVLRGPPIFHESALAAARKMRFTPATKDGEPVSVLVAQRVSFRLPKDEGGNE